LSHKNINLLTPQSYNKTFVCCNMIYGRAKLKAKVKTINLYELMLSTIQNIKKFRKKDKKIA